jgi:arylsulfatase A-like enzyme
MGRVTPRGRVPTYALPHERSPSLNALYRLQILFMNELVSLFSRVNVLCAGLIVGISVLTADNLHAADKPNIVVILADDMGFSDLGCYGGEIATPNLDRLAANGVRFTQFYNTGRCCPTRAALLTGLYSHQAGVGHMTDERKGKNGEVLPGYSGRLNDRCVTIAEALKPAGYFTALVGKWHVGQNLGVTPWGRGFDRSLNAAAGGFYFSDAKGGPLFLNGKDVGRNNDPLPKHWYSTDLWTEYGLKFVDEARAEKKPFFLYVGENAPHFPLQAAPEDIQRWRGKFKTGWDALREARYRRQVEMGLIDRSWPLSPRLPEVPAWESLTAEQQDRYDLLMSIYAAVLERMDRAIGKLIDGLKERGELDNTLILFLSDNGGNAEAGIPGRTGAAGVPGDAKSNVFIGQCWATLNNTPFVRYKHFNDEGGISTPLIAHWPKGIPSARNGKLEKQPGHLVDVMATCIDLAGATYPKEFGGKPITPLQGVSLRPAFQGEDLARSKPIFWEHESNRAIREGQWKLVALENKPWRLYDLAADRSEQQDLAATQPDRVKALSAKWDEWAAASNVLPLGSWRGEPKKGTGSKKLKFVLKQGDHLDKDAAPAVAQRGFRITAKIDAQKPSGVIVAQGGIVHGYALYMHEGKLTFLVRAGGDAYPISTTSEVKGSHVIVAQLKSDGTMSLTVDGQSAAEGKAASTLTKMPLDGLDVGTDDGGLVGDYAEQNEFGGTIESVTIELDSKAGN